MQNLFQFDCVGSYKLINTLSNLFLEPTTEQLVYSFLLKETTTCPWQGSNPHAASDPKITGPTR